MKAKWSNKGYTLVELMITLAIFGIVMLGIAMIMRTTSVSYVSGSNEVSMQTEAQIVANQIEELLVDATGTIGTAWVEIEGVHYRSWSIQNAGVVHNITLDRDKDELLYQKGGTDASSWSLMAEYVTDFDIEGLAYYDTTEGAVQSPDCDNMATIKLSMDKDDHVYTMNRDVYFRNAIENENVYEINEGGGANPDDPNANIEKYSLNRYEILNLHEKFDIVSGVTVSDNFWTNYEFVAVSTSTSNKDTYDAYVSVTSLPDHTYPTDFDMADLSSWKQLCVRTKASINSSPNSSVSESENVILTGVTSKGITVTINLSTDAVSFNIGEGKDVPDGVVIVPTEKGNGSPYACGWIEVTGIDIAAMMTPGGQSYKYAMVLYESDSQDPVYTSGGRPGTYTITDGGLDAVNWYKVNGSMSYNDNTLMNGKYFSLYPDLQGNGFVIYQNEEQWAGSADSSGKLRLAAMIHMPYNNNAESHTVIDFSVIRQGSATTNYAGGNIYTATPSAWGVTF